MSKTGKLMFTSISISILTLALILFLTVDRSTYEVLKSFNMLFLFVAIIFHLLAWASWSFRIKYLSRGIGKDVTVKESFEILVPSLFVAAITPSSIGGEPLRIYMLSKKGLSYGEATAIILGGRLLDFLFVISLALVSTLILGFSTKNVLFRNMLIIALFFVFLGLFFFILGVVKPESIDRIFRKFSFILKRMGKDVKYYSNKLIQEMENLNKALKVLLKEGKGEIMLGILGTVGYWVFDLIVPWVLLLGLGIEASLIQVMVIQLFLYIVILAPITPGSSGLAETSASVMFASLVKPSLLGVFVVMWRFVLYYFNMLAGLVMGMKVVKESEWFKTR
jgi:hypothetical protein